MSKRGWQKAVELAEKRLGSRRAVAARLGITPQAMAQWPPRGPKAEHVRMLEELSGVPRHEIRPDIFDPPERGRAKPRPLTALAS